MISYNDKMTENTKSMLTVIAPNKYQMSGLSKLRNSFQSNGGSFTTSFVSNIRECFGRYSQRAFFLNR